MNVAELDTQLQSLVGTDNVGAPQRSAAIMAACAAYSRYRPVSRRYGYAQLAVPAASAQAVIVVVGGAYRPGDKLILDYIGPAPVSVVVAAVAYGASEETAGSAVGAGSVALVTLTLTANITAYVAEGAYIAPDTAGGQARGLSLASGTDEYALPLDFIRPNTGSLDGALGGKGQFGAGDGFYDAAYWFAIRYSSAGVGRSSNYSAGGWQGWPVLGNINNNPNGGKGSGGSAGGTLFRFYTGSRPRLQVSPAPTSASLIDFEYYGQHVPCTIPAADIDVVLDYARGVCYEQQASELGQIMSGSNDEATTAADRNAKVLMDMAAAAFGRFNARIVSRPYATTG